MKKLICTFFIICATLLVFGQQVLPDEALQARVHYMNAAKVSYIASAEVIPVADIEQNNELEIPSAIMEAFNSKYQGAKKIEWVIKEDRYKVNFVFKGSEMFTYLDRHGLWIKSFIKLQRDQLPVAIGSYLKSQYPSYQLTKYYLKDTPDGQFYTVAVKSTDEYVWLEFDEDGNIISNPA